MTQVHTTSFIGLVARRPLLAVRKAVPTSGSIEGSQALRYRFEPGSIAYLGDFTFDFFQFPVRIVDFKTDAAAARAALQGHAEFKGELAFHGPVSATALVAATDAMLQLEGAADVKPAGGK
jgi:hypothetical protein